MDVPTIARLSDADPSVISGLIAERVAAHVAEAGTEPWERDQARWSGVREALEAAADGAQPAQRLEAPSRWLSAVVEASLRRWSTSWAGTGDVMSVRILERLGLVELDHDDTYVLAFVGGIVGDPRFAATTRADVLRADPDLREAIIWRLFEVEGGGEVSLANLDKFTGVPRQWSTTFHELVDDGVLARRDVLTAALGALARDFSAYRAGWYSRLYTSFNPTPEESGQRQDVLRRLLRSDVPATVMMSLRQLRAVDRAGLLDDEATARSLEPALLQASRAPVDTALTIADSIVQRRPEFREVIAEQVVLALGHPHAEVQQRAGRMLRALGAPDLLAAHADDVSPAVARALGLEVDAGTGVDQTRQDASLAPTDFSLRQPFRPAAGAEAAELMAALLEDASDPMAIERVLAGLAQAGRTDALVPLAKRAASVLARGPRDGVTPGWLRGQLARLVLRSAGQGIPALPWTWDRSGDPQTRHLAARFLTQRIQEVGSIVSGESRPQILCATPEAPAGWIHPRTLVSRVLQGPTTTVDLVGALLRLAPDGRQEALDALDRHPGLAVQPTVARVLRHALGDHPPTPRRLLRERPDAAERALWVAAARAREPLGHDPWAEHLGLTGAGRARPISLRLGVPQPWIDGIEIRDEHLPWVIVDAGAREVRDEQPTAVVDVPRGRFDRDEAEEFIPWVGTLYPADAEHLCWVAGMDVIERAMTYSEVRHDAVRVLAALREHEGRVGRLTSAVLAGGLSATGVDERVRAVDAVTHLTSTGQLVARDLATGILDVGPLTPLPRLAGSLRDTAATSSAAGALVVDSLSIALGDIPVKVRGLHALLEVLLDELIRQNRRTPSDLAAWLAHFRGPSRSARLALSLQERL